MSINWATLRAQIINAAVVAVNATAMNTADRAREKAPVRKIFAGGRQTVRFKTASEIEADRGLRAQLGLAPEILATAQAVGRVQAKGINPKSSTRVLGQKVPGGQEYNEFGFARTIDAPGRTHTVIQNGPAQRSTGPIAHTHTDNRRNLRNRANTFKASQALRLLNPANDYEHLLGGADAEDRLTARGRYELASKRAFSGRIVVDQNTGIPHVVGRVGGKLRDSIRVEKATPEMFPLIKASVVAGGGEVDYAKHQELGNRHNPAHPFLRPSLAEARSELPGAVLRSMRRLGR